MVNWILLNPTQTLLYMYMYTHTHTHTGEMLLRLKLVWKLDISSFPIIYGI
jgi:hypothetical protein